ncbi:ABC transporter substrate-binding protein [Ruania alba]|uniref:Carbohydrate ABC transporter substrate-binding protein, CUT1 family n=1 Tax=Ruania alba TaxID=648782 RepID=A0A1H5KYT9_9MICO|nr:ABC transporter substrate-binding protein [Ruania alba]SEE69874.1 carbohydrate ABC transporter substrate-binding protein, CUT1 family [Ruania alba]
MNRIRQVALAATALVTAGALVACSQSGENGTDGSGADDGASLTLWARGNSMPDDLEGILAEEFGDYTIEFENIPDIEDKMRAALRSGSGLPDVVVFGGGTRQFFSVADQFIDLTEQAETTDSVEWALDLARTEDGQQLALPTDIGPYGFFYRADVLESLGYPSEPDEVAAEIDSWEAYRDLASEAAAEGVYVCDHAGQVHETRLNQNGYGYFALEDGEEVNIVDSPVSHDSFVFAADLAQDGLCADAEPYTPEFNAALTQEQVVGFVGPAWQDGLIRSAGEQQAGQWRVTRLPGGPAASGGSFVAALAESEHPDAAAEVAGFIGGAEFQTASYLDKGLFPGSLGVAEDPEASAPQDFYGGQNTLGLLMEMAEGAPITYRGVDSSTVGAQFYVALTDIASTGDDPEQVYASLVEQSAGL